MTPYELLDLALSLSNRIDTHWTLFITVHLALIGGIIYVDRPLLRNEKIAAMIIYTGFAVVNFLMMRSQAHFLSSIYQQLVNMKDLECCIDNKVIDYVFNLHKQGNISKMLTSITVTHFIMYFILMLSIFYDKSKTKKQGSESTKK